MPQYTVNQFFFPFFTICLILFAPRIVSTFFSSRHKAPLSSSLFSGNPRPSYKRIPHPFQPYSKWRCFLRSHVSPCRGWPTLIPRSSHQQLFLQDRLKQRICSDLILLYPMYYFKRTGLLSNNYTLAISGRASLLPELFRWCGRSY